MKRTYMIWYENEQDGTGGVCANPDIIRVNGERIPYIVHDEQKAIEYAEALDKKYEGQGFNHYAVQLVQVKKVH